MNSISHHLFPDRATVRVTKADTARLRANLSGYNRLCVVLMTCEVSEDDLRKMLLIETAGKKRAPMLAKIIGRICSVERERLHRAVKGIPE